MYPVKLVTNPYITWDSDFQPTDPDYKPYVDENGNYYVPENMENPVRFFEIEDAPSLNAMSYFVGVGSDNKDYLFTPGQLVAYVQSQTRKVFTATGDGDAFSDDFIDDTITEVVTLGQAYDSSMFTIAGNTLTPPGGVLDGQVFILKK